MRLSVVIPCHNAAAYLGQTIGSLLEQTREPDEIIVVDDGSTDGSGEVARGFGGRVQVIPVRFGGASRTRNHGFTFATGDGILFLDADDVLGPGALEALEEALHRNPGGVALCPWYRLELQDGRWVRRPPSGPRSLPGHDRLGGWLMGRYHPPCAVLWSRKAYLRTGGWDEQALVNNDGDIMMRAMIEGVPMVETPHGSAFYRRLPPGETSLSGRRLTPEGIEAGLRVLHKIASRLEERGRLEGYREALGVAFRRIADDCGTDHPVPRARAEAGARRYGGIPVTSLLRREARRWGGRTRRGIRRRLARRGPGPSPEPRNPEPEPEEIRYGMAWSRRAEGEGPRSSATPAGPDAPAGPGDAPPAVSVIIPTYNRAELVTRAIGSVLGQTFQDFEVLVVDDGSTDATEAVVGEVGDPRVRYLRQPHNQGVSAARNRGMREARGPFIAFLDSDDEWFPEKLERQVECLRAAPADVGLVYTGVRSETGDGSAWSFRPEHRGDVYPGILEANPIHSGSSVMIRRNVIRVAGFFDEEIPAIEDFEYWIRIARFHRFEVIPEPLVRYHDARRSDRKSLATQDNLDARAWLFRKHRREMEEAGLAHRFLMKSSERHLKRWDGRCDSVTARLLALQALRRAPGDPEAHAFMLRMLLPKRFQSLPRRLRRWTRGRWSGEALES